MTTTKARIVSELDMHDPYCREATAEHALHKKCAIILNVRTITSDFIMKELTKVLRELHAHGITVHRILEYVCTIFSIGTRQRDLTLNVNGVSALGPPRWPRYVAGRGWPASRKEGRASPPT